MKLAIAQMVFGAIVVGSLWSPWFLGLPPYLVPSLAVLGCGIAQFLKAMDSEMRELIERCVKDFKVDG